MSIKALFQQTSHYFTGRIALMAAGFISFPILTRILSVEDYGLLGLISTTIFLTAAFGKMGFPAAIVRLYSECREKGKLKHLYSTAFASSLTASATVAAAFYVTARMALAENARNDVNLLIALVTIYIVIRGANDILMSFLRAEQRTKQYAVIAVIRRYVSLAFGVFLVLFVIGGVKGLLTGQVIIGASLFAVLYWTHRKKVSLSGNFFSKSIFKESFAYGFPLLWGEVGILLLNYIDRYFVHFYAGAVPLGLYTAGYNLSKYVTDSVIQPMKHAMEPIYLKILAGGGEEETKVFLAKSLRYFFLFMCPVSLGFIAVGENLIVLMASNRYFGAAHILPYIVIGQMIHASTLILNNGLFISKKTYVVSIITIGTCIVNIALNFLLVPRYGIMGAAQATLLSFLLEMILIVYFSFREFSFKIEYAAIAKYMAASLAMLWAVRSIQVGGYLTTIICQFSAGAALYIFLVVSIDRDVRMVIMRQIRGGMALI